MADSKHRYAVVACVCSKGFSCAECTVTLSDATAAQGMSVVQETSHLTPHLGGYHISDLASKEIDRAILSERRFWARFTGHTRRERGKKVPGWLGSIKNVVVCSCESDLQRCFGLASVHATLLHLLSFEHAFDIYPYCLGGPLPLR